MRSLLLAAVAGALWSADTGPLRVMSDPGFLSVAGRSLATDGALCLPVEIHGARGPVVLRVAVRTVSGGRGGRVTVSGDGRHLLHLPWRSLDPTDDAPERGLTLHVDGSTAGLTVFAGAPWISSQPQGPVLGEADLFAHLEWRRPGLEAIRVQVAAGNFREAGRLLAAHVRSRPRTWRFPPITDRAAVLRHADRILAGDVRWIGLQRTFPKGEIDWLANHSLGTPQETHEWVWALNRHADLVAVAQAYRATGDERYATAWVRLTRSWILQAPPPSLPDERPGSVWRTLDSGLRMTGAWFTGLYAVMDSPALTDEDLLLVLRSLWDHGAFLARAPYNPSNHVVFGMSGLYTIGAQMPEFREAPTWRTHAGSTLERLLTEGVLADGAWYELSPGYGQWVVDHLVALWTNAEQAGEAREISLGMRERLQALAEWGVQIMAPDRTAPMLNDGVRLVHRPATVTALAERFPDSDLLRWLARDLQGGPAMEAPRPASGLLAASGYAVLRSDWSRTGTFLVLDGGPLGGWHGHQDALNLVAWFHGREFLFDNGGHKYDTSIWRRWAITSAAHSTVLVDGLGQARSWNEDQDPIGILPPGLPPARCATSAQVDWASAWYGSGYAAEVADRGRRSDVLRATPAMHHRAVVLVKDPAQGPLALVVDTLVPGDGLPHRYEARWQLKTRRWSTAEDGRLTWTTDAGLPNLAVASLGGATEFRADSGVRDPEPLGWWYEHQNAVPTPALTLRQAVTASGTTRLLTALVPFTGDPTAAPLAVSSPVADVWTLRRAGHPDLTIRLTPPVATGPGLTIDGLTIPAAP